MVKAALTKKRGAAAATLAPAAASASKKKKAAVAAAVAAGGVPSSEQALGKVETRVDKAQALRAAQALLQHHAKVQAERMQGGGKKPGLLEDEGEEGEDFIYAQVALERIPERVSPKPVAIKLPVPLYRAGKDDHAVCIIVKEADKGKVKRALQALKLDGVSEVVGLQELRTDYKDYQERRKLRDAFDLFLVDDRILPLLGKALGKVFFSKKKQPAALKLGALLSGSERGAATVGKRIVAARNRTYLVKSHGTCLALRVARTSMTPQQVVANLLAGVAGAVEAIPRKWKNVMNVSVKTSRSVALPVYQRLPQYLVKQPKAQLPGDPLLLAALAKVEAGEGKSKAPAAAAAKAAKAPAAVGKGEGKGKQQQQAQAQPKGAEATRATKRPREVEGEEEGAKAAAAAAAPAAKKKAVVAAAGAGGKGKGKGKGKA